MSRMDYMCLEWTMLHLRWWPEYGSTFSVVAWELRLKQLAMEYLTVMIVIDECKALRSWCHNILVKCLSVRESRILNSYSSVHLHSDHRFESFHTTGKSASLWNRPHLIATKLDSGLSPPAGCSQFSSAVLMVTERWEQKIQKTVILSSRNRQLRREWDKSTFELFFKAASRAFQLASHRALHRPNLGHKWIWVMNSRKMRMLRFDQGCNLIRMSMLKVIDRKQSRIHQEFEQRKEYKLMLVMNIQKMLQFRLDRTWNLIRMPMLKAMDIERSRICRGW
jgi:hypothetical protein